MVNDCAGAEAGENDNPFSNRSSASFVLIKSAWRNIRFMKLVLFVSDLLEYNKMMASYLPVQPNRSRAKSQRRTHEKYHSAHNGHMKPN